MENLPRPIWSRRQLLQVSGLSGLGLLLNGCSSSFLADVAGQLTEPLNQQVDSLIFNPAKLAPEFPASQIQPEALLVNTFGYTPEIDPTTYRLQIEGEVAQPLSLSLADLQTLPFASMTIRHVCVEGWAAIVQWGGVRLRDLATLVQPNPGVRYVYFESADRYYESWDLASALHPQTLLAYQRNGQPLEIDYGAPLRLASPIKLGYKQSKWVMRLRFVSQLSPRRGYWEDQGYEWFAGL